MELNTLGVVGLGSIGRRHLRLAKEIRPELQIVAVRSGLGGEVPEEKLIASTVGSLEEGFDRGIEAAIVATPAHRHAALLRTLLVAGIPYLVEKPLAMNAREAEALAPLAQECSGLGMVGYNLRYSTSLQHLRSLLDTRAVGDVLHVSIECGSYLPDWRPGRDYRTTPSSRADLGGGVLRELSHELEYALWLFGPIRSIKAALRNTGTLDIDVEDIAVLHLESENKHPISVHLDFCRRHPRRSCTVFGTDGQLTWDGISQTVELRKTAYTKSTRWFPEERDEMYRRQLHHFFEVVEQGVSPLITFTSGAEVLRLIDAARESDAKGCTITL